MNSKYKLSISYDGTRYSGWQTQPNAFSIQTHVENALSTALHEHTPVVGSGRTDAGVHALEQVAHFSTEQTFDFHRLHRSLNGILPIDIRINAINKVPDSFHARYSARGKIYRYYLNLGKTINPFRRLYSYYIPYPLNQELLKTCTTHFVGTHDFTSFSNEADRGSAGRNPVRTIKRLDIYEKNDELILEFEGEGFLYKMVRNCVGTLLDIARGKILAESLSAIFDAKDRKKAGACAPPHGLFLSKVIY